MAGFIGAEGFLAQIIEGCAVGSGPAAATQAGELADAALATQLGRVAQLGEEGGAFPGFLKGLIADVARFHRQIAAGEDFAPVADKADAKQTPVPARQPLETARMAASPLADPPLAAPG